MFPNFISWGNCHSVFPFVNFTSILFLRSFSMKVKTAFNNNWFSSTTFFCLVLDTFGKLVVFAFTVVIIFWRHFFDKKFLSHTTFLMATNEIWWLGLKLNQTLKIGFFFQKLLSVIQKCWNKYRQLFVRLEEEAISTKKNRLSSNSRFPFYFLRCCDEYI